MANFNFVIDCNDETEAVELHEFIQSLDIYQTELEIEGEEVNLVSKQGLLSKLEQWADEHAREISVELYPEGLDFDEAEEQGQVESYSYGGEN